MSPTIKEAAPLILAKIQKGERVLLHCHPGPDPDSLGGVLAMREVLLTLGKEVTAIRGDSEVPEAFSRFPGYETIENKSYGEINPVDYDLFIILDSGSIGQVTKKMEVVFPDSLETILIDHHATNTGFARLNCIDPSYPATCQILYDLFKLWGVTLDETIATNLIMGIYGDTGGFKYRGTTEETFKAAAELVSLAPKFSEVIFKMENSEMPSGLAFQALALHQVERFFNDHVAVSIVSCKDLETHGINRNDAQGSSIATRLRTVIGWDICASLVEKEQGLVSISMRSRDPERYDVSRIVEILGGGGHKAAAGALYRGAVEEAKKAILSAVSKQYPEFNESHR